MSLNTQTLPRLYYPFEDLISPYAAQLEAETKKWIYNDYAFLPEEIKKKYDHTNAGYLMARFYPLATFEQLIPLARFSLWGLTFDDFYEHQGSQQIRVLRKRVMDILQGAAPLPSENDLFPQLATMRDELSKLMPPNWMARFTISMDKYIEGMELEAPYKATLQFPPLQEYMAIREKSVDVYPLIDFVELVTTHALPDEVVNHPIMQKIAALTCRMIAWCNDYFSVQKEQGRDIMNIILVAQHEYNLSLEDAYAAAVRIHEQDLEAYLQLIAALPDFGSYNEQVQQFIYYNGLMIQGHKSWYEIDTRRYGKGGHPEADRFK